MHNRANHRSDSILVALGPPEIRHYAYYSITSGQLRLNFNACIEIFFSLRDVSRWLKMDRDAPEDSPIYRGTSSRRLPMLLNFHREYIPDAKRSSGTAKTGLYHWIASNFWDKHREHREPSGQNMSIFTSPMIFYQWDRALRK